MQSTRQRTTRRTREQSTHEAEDQFDDSFLFEETGALPDIPARPGMAQYWARAKHGGIPDARNMLRMKRRGWHPRKADSVPKSFVGMTIHDETLGGVISTDDLILMERPIELQKRVIAHHKQVVDDKERAVKRNLFADHQQLGGTDTGFTAPEVSTKARIERGRPTVLLDDDET